MMCRGRHTHRGEIIKREGGRFVRKKRLRTQESVECVRKADVLRGAGGRWREKVREGEGGRETEAE